MTSSGALAATGDGDSAGSGTAARYHARQATAAGKEGATVYRHRSGTFGVTNYPLPEGIRQLETLVDTYGRISWGAAALTVGLLAYMTYVLLAAA